MMRISEEPLAESIAGNLAGAAEEGAELLSVPIDTEPLKIIESLNEFVANPPKRRSKKVDNWGDRALPLGALWGAQMQRQFGWEWASVIHHDHNDAKFISVFDQTRSLGIYPFHYIFGCLENNVYPTILLAFNMLVAGKIPDQPAQGFMNLMDGVQHIVPPR